MHPSNVSICAIFTAIVSAICYFWWPHLGLGLAAEHAPLAWLQASLLVACAVVAGLRSALDTGRSAVCWAVLAMLLTAAALDERFMGHERIQDWLAEGVAAGWPGGERLVQGVTAVYAIGGFALLAWLRYTVSEPAWLWCRAAILVGTVAIGLDLAFDAIGPQIFEELLEAVAETLMLCGLFTEVRMRAIRPQ